MSVLFPLFLAGLGALSLPLLFHLVRRTPRGRTDFSSLMFLAPTVPRLTRRSRLDQILLLLLRLAALALIALAFSRPFLRESASLALSDLPGRRVALLIDISASMQRSTLWKQALDAAEKELAGLNAQDDVALYSFDDRLETVIGFEPESLVAGKADLVRNRLRELAPAWGGTDLGGALTTVAAELEATGDLQQSTLEPQIVLISDLTQGARLEALDATQWPDRVKVSIPALKPSTQTNAYAHILTGETQGAIEDVRVRVVNAAQSRNDQFSIHWSLGEESIQKSPDVPVYVPAGQSRVVRLPRGAEFSRADRIVLRGDDEQFDNVFYVVPPAKRRLTIWYDGKAAADDPQGLLYYLKLAVSGDLVRDVEIVPLDPATLTAPGSDQPAPLAVVTRPLATAAQGAVQQFLSRGGIVVFVPEGPEARSAFPDLFDDLELKPESRPGPDQFLLFGEIDFTHPLFAPFANPPYSDFTKIHFWKHATVALKTPATTAVIARFDNGDPALLERRVDRGRLIALTSSWAPGESQLALSSKFVGLVGALLDLAVGTTDAPPSLVVNQPVPLPSRSESESCVVTNPEGTPQAVPSGQQVFAATSRPGIYQVSVAGTQTPFAVNLSTHESNTSPLEPEQLERRGVKLGSSLTRAERIERVRQQRDTELESRQKLWQWLLATTLVLLIIESWWAGRAERKMERSPSG